jgi:dolichyl-phosphate-mannose-protein mannosyltransferase
MARSSTPSGSVRQRNVASKKGVDAATFNEPEIDKLAKAAAQKLPAGSERDYKIALAAITALAFVTRFWGITHPNEVVFDEVHFGKVSVP